MKKDRQLSVNKTSTSLSMAAEAEDHLGNVLSHLTKINEIPMRHNIHLTGGHTHKVMALLAVPGKDLFLSAAEDCTIRLWDEKIQKNIRVYQGHQDGVRVLAWRPGWEQFISGGWDNQCILWDFDKAEIVKRFEGHTDRLRAIVVFSDGRTMVTLAKDQTIRLWDMGSGECLQVRDDHKAEVRCGVMHSSGTIFYSGAINGTLIKWTSDLSKSEILLHEEGNGIHSMVLTKDGEHLLTGTEKGELLILSTQSNKLLHRYQMAPEAIYSLSLDSTGQKVCLGTDYGVMRWVDWQTGNRIVDFAGPGNVVMDVKWINNDLVYIGSSNRGVEIALKDGQATKIFWSREDQEDFIGRTVFSQDKSIMAIAYDRNIIHVYDYKQTRRLCSFEPEHKDTFGIKSMTISPDNRYLIAAQCKEWVSIWDLVTQQKVMEFKAFVSDIRGVLLVNNNQHLIVAGRGIAENIWIYTIQGKLLQKITGHENTIFCLTANVAGDTFATASADGTVKLWETATFKCKQILKGSKDWMMRVAFSADGKRVVGGGSEGEIILWETESGRLLTLIKAGYCEIKDIDLNHDGTRIAAGSNKMGIQGWTDDNQKLFHILGNRRRHLAATLNTSGSRLLVNSFSNVNSWQQESILELTTYGATQQSVLALFVDEQHDRLFVSANATVVKGLDFRTGEEIISVFKSNNSAIAMALRNHGSQLLLMDNISLVNGVDLISKKKNLFLECRPAGTAMAYARESQHLFCGDKQGDIKQWNITTIDVEWQLPGKGKPIVAISLDQEAQFLMTLDEAGWLRIIYLPKKELLFDAMLSGAGTCSMTLDQEQEQLLIGKKDGTLYYFDIIHHEIVHTVTFASSVESILVMDHLPYTCLGLGNGHIVILNRHGEIIHQLAGHQEGLAITCMQVDSSRNLLLSGSQDGTIKFWDLQDNTLCGTYYFVEDSFLWTTPPDEQAPNGWFWTDTPKLINIVECNEDGSNAKSSEHKDETRMYFTLYHNRENVLKRIFNYPKYKRDMKIKQKRKVPVNSMSKQLEAGGQNG